MALIRQVVFTTVLVFLSVSALGGVAQGAGSSPSASAQAPVQPLEAPARPVLLAPKATAQIARSALLAVDGTATADSLQLNIRRVADKSPVASTDITVSVDGKNEPVTAVNGGGYEIPVNDFRGGDSRDAPRDVEIIVPHDGIREILSGKVTVTQPASVGGLLGDHKQMAWWILNIVIVLIAAMALSRRKS